MSSTLLAPQREFYQRHLSLPQFGEQGQQRLAQAKILCVGAGGLACGALPYLAAAGIGSIGIVDDDTVSDSNLQRQVMYTYADIGSTKVELAKQRLQAANPFIDVVAYPQRLTLENAVSLFAGYDVILDASDNVYTRYLVNDVAVSCAIPVVYASVDQFHGQCALLALPGQACYRCIYPQVPTALPNCAESGVLGVLPGIMGALQALQAVRFLAQLGTGEQSLLLFDALTLQWRTLRLQQDPQCSSCVQHKPLYQLAPYQQESSMDSITVEELKQWQARGDDFVLLDVREPAEYDAFNLKGKLIPLAQLPEQLNDLDPQQQYVIHCKSGGRSLKACQLLQAHGFTKVTNLTGGVLAWQQASAPE